MTYDPLRDVEAEKQAGADEFDRAYFRMFGRFPAESRLTEQAVRDDHRRAAIQALAEQGATEGERAAARAALQRLDAEAEAFTSGAQDLADEEDAAEWGEL